MARNKYEGKAFLNKKVFDNDDIQLMIEHVNKDKELREELFLSLKTSSVTDRGAIRDVLKDGFYERFERYDSDVCEQFIRAYISARKDLCANVYAGFTVGEQVIYLNTDFDAVNREVPCVVKAIYTDHMMITDVETDTDLWIEDGFNLDCVKRK